MFVHDGLITVEDHQSAFLKNRLSAKPKADPFSSKGMWTDEVLPNPGV